MSHLAPAYLVIDESAFAFSGEGEINFRVFPKGEALATGNVFIVDIYAADDHSHPDGHAGWWEYPLTGVSSVEVRVRRDEEGLTAFFDGEPAQKFWHNNEFCAEDRLLIMHLVVREWRSTTILFNDPISLYPNQKPLEASKHCVHPSDLPDEIPLRWFIWPSQRRILLVFGSLNSKGAQTLCRQFEVLLCKNNIPFSIYAHEYSSEQRRSVKPVEYLFQNTQKDDIIFFMLAEGGPALSIVAGLSCKKILYHMQLPDYRRYQAFDAEFARKLEELKEQQQLIMNFDGICYESKHTENVVTLELYKQASLNLQKEWRVYHSSNGKLSMVPVETCSKKKKKAQKVSEEILLCELPQGSPEFLPQRLALTVATPRIPPSLGNFPPVLWHKNWDKVKEETCLHPEKFILSVGSFCPDRHHELTLKIFAEIAEQLPSIGLVIAGWPFINGYWDYIRFLREHIYATYLDRIILLQDCSCEKLLHLYKRASVFITSSSNKGYNDALLTALKFNIPVVAKSTQFTSAALNMSGLQFNARTNSSEIVNDILNLFNDEEFKNKIIQSQKENLFNNNMSPGRMFFKSIYEVLSF